MTRTLSSFALVAILIFTSSALAAKETSTKVAPPVDEAYTWNLEAIYPNETAWHAEMDTLKKRIPEMKACENHLGDSGENLKKCLDLYFEISRKLSKFGTWSGLKEAGDIKNAKNIENEKLAEDSWSTFSENSSFYSPEIAKLGRDKVEKMEKKFPALAVYHQYLRVILDQTEHTLDSSQEQMLASLNPILYSSGEVQSLLLDSDIVWKSVKLSDGKMHVVDQTTYEKFRESTHREDREKVFKAFYEVLSQFQHTFGSTLGTAFKRNVTLAHIRKYPNALTAALDSNKIPEEVYRSLIKEVNAGLPVFHSYLELQKKRLGVKTLEYSDVYAPIGKYSENFPIDKTEKTVLAAVAPLGPDYQQKLSKAFSERWADVYPRSGKNTGGFMNPGAYGVHPFLLLNHQDNFSSASTLAHEFGHAMHSVYAGSAQPYVYSDYATFIAEIASTTNEILLREYLIRNAKSKAERFYYLDELMKEIRTTFFRQAQFAEFELRGHEELEKGGALSGQKLTEIYGQIISKYYGAKEGVTHIDPAFNTEWAFIPHFYGGFYVFQYATSISAGFYFAENILAGKPGALEQYLNVLKSGSSKYPYEILMDAGIDMKSPAVYQALIERMRTAVEEMKASDSQK